MADTPEIPEATLKTLSATKCPVCLEFPFNKKIYQCPNGHLVCEECSQRVTVCPTCRVVMTSPIRNLIVERVLNNIEEHYNIPDLQTSLADARSQRRIRLCAQLGFRACRFETEIPQKFQDHLVESHQLQEIDENYLSFDFCSWTDSQHPRYAIFGRNQRSQNLDSRNSFLFVIKKKENLDGIMVHCIFIGQSFQDSKSFRIAYYFTSSNMQKCVASWPTLWCSDAAITLSETSVWDKAYHVSEQTLHAIQGQDDKVNLLVRIRNAKQ